MFKVAYECIAPTRPFLGITRGSTLAVGKVRLHYHTEFIVFVVAHIDLPYNAISGYPMFSKLMDATHHAYGHTKMLGCTSTLTIHYDERDATHALASACCYMIRLHHI